MTEDSFYDDFANRGDGERHPAWSWKDKPPGTVFEGVIRERFKFTDKKNDQKRMGFHVETGDGMVTLFVSQWQLERAISERGPAAGERLKIRYDGIDPEDGQSKKFSVRVDPGPESEAPQPGPDADPSEFSTEVF